VLGLEFKASLRLGLGMGAEVRDGDFRGTGAPREEMSLGGANVLH